MPAMMDIKNNIGYARAWVRRSLERHVFSTHLRTLLPDSALLTSQYKRHTFLRYEEDTPQLLRHLP
jgi:hypothetical protein